ncbi:MAG: type VI secretion system tube protein TssD [Candidatus Zixiibacteriota bacterium]
MPMPCYLTIPEYPGSCVQEGHEDCIFVEAVQHNVSVPVDPHSGSKIGHRMHRPLRITKAIDKSSPGLFKAMTTGQTLEKITLDFYRIDNTGVEENYYRITLGDVHVVDVVLEVPNCAVPANDALPHMEHVAFTYRTITWEHLIDSVVEMDEWYVQGD